MNSLEQILTIAKENQLGPNRMDRKHIIEHCNNALKQIEEICEKELVKV